MMASWIQAVVTELVTFRRRHPPPRMMRIGKTKGMRVGGGRNPHRIRASLKPSSFFGDDQFVRCGLYIIDLNGVDDDYESPHFPNYLSAFFSRRIVMVDSAHTSITRKDCNETISVLVGKRRVKTLR